MSRSSRVTAYLMIAFLGGLVLGAFAERAWVPYVAPLLQASGAQPGGGGGSVTGPGAGGGAGGRGLPAASAPEAQVGPETEVVTRTRYSEGDCAQTLEQTTKAPADWVGMTRSDLAARYPDAAVTEFSAERVVIERQAVGCPYRGRTILLRMGRVGVYYGTLNDLGPLQRETDITEDQLTSADRERLQTGIVVESDEEVDALLEGLRQ